MKYQKLGLWSFSLALALTVVAGAQTQQPAKKRPMKNQPQYPRIIGGDEKDAPQEKTEPAPTAAGTTPQPSEQLVRAVESLAGEVRSLVQEMRALNVRQQAQIDVLRMTRNDLRIDLYDRELKTTRDRLAQLESDEQNLQLLIKPEGLEAQLRSIPTLDRDTTMRQIKAGHEARLRAVQAEKELLQKREAELSNALAGYRASTGDAEKRLQHAEEMLRQLNAPPADQRGYGQPDAAKPTPAAPERRP